VKLGLIQNSCSATIGDNYDKTVGLIREAARRGAQIICTQELFKSPYFCQIEDWKNFDLAEEVSENSPAVLKLSELAAELQVVLIASLFEKRAAGIYHNTTVVFDADGSFLGKYRKMHIPDDPLYYEKYYFTPGDLGYKVFKTRYADVGVLICWDQWFPEAARLLGLQGAEVIFIPTAIGFSAPGEGVAYAHAWQTVQQGHAVANACFLAAVNRVGFEAAPPTSTGTPNGDLGGVGPNGERGINFWGRSFVVDPDGRIVAQASGEQEEIIVYTVDLSLIEETKKRFSFPYRDRRVDSYQDLLKLYSDKSPSQK
jgi:N-carbamoylputrescine amidase